jgi:hypothetical protein
MRGLLIGLLLGAVLSSSYPVGVSAQAELQDDLVPMAEEFGVGYIQHGALNEPYWHKIDGPDFARYGTLPPPAPPASGQEFRAWAMYDVSHFPPVIEVTELTLIHYINPYVEPEHLTDYGRLIQDLRGLDAETCWNALEGDNYQSIITPGVEGEVVTVLGNTANQDFEDAVKGDGLFGISISGCCGFESNLVWMKGWEFGYPRLTVIYQNLVPAQLTSWGKIKSLYR